MDTIDIESKAKPVITTHKTIPSAHTNHIEKKKEDVSLLEKLKVFQLKLDSERTNYDNI